MKTPPPTPTGAGSPVSGVERPRTRGSPSVVPPTGAEVRTKEWAGRIRRYYSEEICSAVNHPADPHRFPSLRWDLRRTRGAAEDDLVLGVLDDPDYPATRVAQAIKEVVRGEEDQDWEVYEAGARYLLLMLAKYPIVVDPALHVGRPSRSEGDAPTGEGSATPQPEPHTLPAVPFDFEDAHWVRLNLSLVVARDASWNSSPWLLQEFVRYELFYKGRLLRLGVCHNPMCERLYVKANHAGSTQSFCNRACGDAARRQHQAP